MMGAVVGRGVDRGRYCEFHLVDISAVGQLLEEGLVFRRGEALCSEGQVGWGEGVRGEGVIVGGVLVVMKSVGLGGLHTWLVL